MSNLARAVAALAAVGLFAAAVAGRHTTAAQTAPDTSKLATSLYAAHDVPLAADPGMAFWQAVAPIVADRDTFGAPVPGHRTIIFSRWTRKNLYILFVCPYQQLYLKENPQTAIETNKLWNWDVAEVFIGSNFEDIQRYKEFEMSPQGEWLDLDINLAQRRDSDWKWNSGFAVRARIDAAKKIWYGAMRIPFASIAAPGYARAAARFRINFYRSQGPPAAQKRIAWQPTQKSTFHVPAVFGLLRLSGGR